MSKPRFKKGDRVVVTGVGSTREPGGPGWNSMMDDTIGQEAVVSEVLSEGFMTPRYYLDRPCAWWYNEDSLRLAEATAPDGDEDDPYADAKIEDDPYDDCATSDKIEVGSGVLLLREPVRVTGYDRDDEGHMVGRVCEVCEYDDNDDTYLLERKGHGESFDSLWVGPELIRPARPDEEINIGDRVRIVQGFKEEEHPHLGWNAKMKDMIGENYRVDDHALDGDAGCERDFNLGGHWFPMSSLRKLELDPREGDRVRIARKTDREGIWSSNMEKMIGREGWVVRAAHTGQWVDVKVYGEDMDWSFDICDVDLVERAR